MKRRYLLIALLFSFAFVGVAQEKNKVKLNENLNREVMYVLDEADVESKMELKEARGNFVHWFEVSEFILTHNEEDDIYTLTEVKLEEIELEGLYWNLNLEEEEEILSK